MRNKPELLCLGTFLLTWRTNIAPSHHDLTSFQYYKAAHKNDYQKVTLAGIKHFWDDTLPTPPTSFLQVWCGMCSMLAKESLFFSAALGGVSGSDKSAQGESRRPICGTHWGRVWESPGPAGPAPPPDRAVSVPLQLPLLGVGQRGVGRPHPFFWWWLFHQPAALLCFPPGICTDDWQSGCHPKNTTLLSTEDTTPWNKPQSERIPMFERDIYVKSGWRLSLHVCNRINRYWHQLSATARSKVIIWTNYCWGLEERSSSFH